MKKTKMMKMMGNKENRSKDGRKIKQNKCEKSTMMKMRGNKENRSKDGRRIKQNKCEKMQR